MKLSKGVGLLVLSLLSSLPGGCDDNTGAPRVSTRRDGAPPIFPVSDAGVDGRSDGPNVEPDGSVDASVDGRADAGSTAALTLAATGQSTCYSGQGVTRSCVGSGQDGEVQSGLAWPSPRFTPLGDGTLRDNLTDLVWLSDGNCMASNFPGFDDQDTQSELGDGIVNAPKAFEFVNSVNDGTYASCAAGQSDWRLPNVNELLSLVHAGEASSAAWLNSNGFSNVHGANVWTSTLATGTDAWMVNLLDGSNDYWWAAQDLGSVMLVRGNANNSVAATGVTSCLVPAVGLPTSCEGSAQDGEWQAGTRAPEDRFVANGDGTTTDTFTGLMWFTDPECFVEYPEIQSGGTLDGRLLWSEVFAYVSGVNSGSYEKCGAGHKDWRVPNRHEYQSLVSYELDFTRQSALADGISFGQSAVEAALWTSTSSAAKPAEAWQFLWHRGRVLPLGKNEELPVVLVRDK